MSAKYVIIIPDGAADEPLQSLGGKTPLEAAEIPHMDRIASEGGQGLVRTVPEGMEPGSDVAQMSLLGYDPRQFYSGRAPIEAAAKNIRMGSKDWAFRCNLVTIEDGKMSDHSAGHISTVEAAVLLGSLAAQVGNKSLEFHPGVSYRHLLICRDMDFDVRTNPPHDHIGEPVSTLMPTGRGAETMLDLMSRSTALFKDHEINRARRASGKRPATSIWLWGQGRQASLPSFQEKWGLRGAAITAVDLIRGLAKLVGFKVIEVPGATGFFDTNYRGKADAAIKALEENDLVFVHIEAPDEASHEGNAEIKVKALERIDELVVAPVYEALKKYPQWRILVMPDHSTLVRTRSHCGGPIPFAMAGSGVIPSGGAGKFRESAAAAENGAALFSEKGAAAAGLRIENGHTLMGYFLRGK
jgi:2,3-bisphosphoglycerate-independent phosphoglycerate mutase